MGASHSVTIKVTSSMSWKSLQDEVEAAGVPSYATPRLHVDKGYNQMDPGSDDIIFTWRTPGKDGLV